MSAVVALRPVGIYLAAEVGRLAGVSGDRIGQWARRGYISPSQGKGPPNLYSYQDVAEAMVVHDLLVEGVDLGDIRRTVETLRFDYGDWPLTRAELWVQDETKAVAVREGGEFFEASRKRMPLQGIYNVGRLKRIVNDLERGGWAARELDDLTYIEVNPERLSGRPTIRGMRVEADVVAEIAREAAGRRRLRQEYELTDQEIDDAVRWWEKVSSYDAA